LGQDIPDVEVYSLGYDAPPSTWFGSAMALPDRATGVLAALVAERLDTKPLVFVSHSLGGLVVKQLLRTAADIPGTPEGRVLEQTKGAIFLGTPNTGSDLANWADRFRAAFRPYAATQDLKFESPWLRDLNVWYRDRAPAVGIATLPFVETRPTAGVTVVDQATGDPGITGTRSIPVDADHLAIAKPAGRDHLVYKRVLRFLEERLPQPKEAPPASSPGLGPRRFFISYRRRAAEDSQLARFLCDGIKKAGHEAFIDVGMVVGTEWSKEIERRIEWCEFLVVLLSEETLESEMVQEEVRRAHHRRKTGGSPAILPVRVAYEGPLDYTLGAYLGRLQYVLWRNAQDSQAILASLLEVAASGPDGALREAARVQPDAQQTPAAIAEPQRPRPVADPRVLRQPGGAMRPDDPCYLRRETDDVVEAIALHTGTTMGIKAPQQMGKTSLLIRYLAKCKEAGKRTALVDFQIFTAEELDDLPTTLNKLASELLGELGIDPILGRAIPDTAALTHFIRDTILAKIEQPVVLAFDEVDSLVSRSYRDSFFAMLRHWHNLRAMKPQQGWDRLDLALVIATEPSMFIEDATQSPFNVTDPIRLEPFRREDLTQINEHFGAILAATALDQLDDLLGGQPYLSRLAFYHIAGPRRMDFGVLTRKAADDNGPFGEHLRAKLTQLQRRLELGAALKQLIRREVQPAEPAYYRLHAAGLVLRDDRGRIVPANLLYARFFERVL
jgi:pimeloyl-ACP methyl ester carboxylesterase